MAVRNFPKMRGRSVSRQSSVVGLSSVYTLMSCTPLRYVRTDSAQRVKIRLFSYNKKPVANTTVKCKNYLISKNDDDAVIVDTFKSVRRGWYAGLP